MHCYTQLEKQPTVTYSMVDTRMPGAEEEDLNRSSSGKAHIHKPTHTHAHTQRCSYVRVYLPSCLHAYMSSSALSHLRLAFM